MKPALIVAIWILPTSFTACGSVTVSEDLGAPVDATADTALVDRRPGPLSESPETQPPIDGGALPTCPPEILHYDCPQPKCDCRDR